MLYQQTIPQILEAINNSNHILLVSHEKPDGDTLGSSLALSQFLSQKGKQHKHFCLDKPASYFAFLPKIENIISDYKLIDLSDHDLIIAIDCGAIARTGIASDLLNLKGKTIIVNIDHHQSNDNFGHYNLVVPNASSTSEIIYNFFILNKIPIDKYMATSLMTGILTDTMNFTNAITTQESLKAASDLLSLGARVNQIVTNLSQNKDLTALKLWGKILSRLEINHQKNFAYTVVTKEDLAEAQIPLEAVDGLANFLSNLQDVDYILVLTQIDDETIKGSLRTTKDNIDVAKIAKDLGGDGHKKAAGFKIKGKLVKTGSGWEVL